MEWFRKGDIDFSKVHSVNLDEYVGLSPEHEQNYYNYIENNFFQHINIRPESMHGPDGLARDTTAECTRYDRLIAGLGGIDLQLLGVRHTGHIGFNEPDQNFNKMTHRVELKQKTIDANARFFSSADEVPRYALTMGIKAIVQAKKILLVANGESKADILYRSLFGPVTPAVPASILQLHPDVTVVADQAALSKIQEHAVSY